MVLYIAEMDQLLPYDVLRKGKSTPLEWVKFRTPGDASTSGQMYQLRRQAIKELAGGWAILGIYDEIVACYGGDRPAPLRGWVVNDDLETATDGQIARTIGCGDARLLRRALRVLRDKSLLLMVPRPNFEEAFKYDRTIEINPKPPCPIRNLPSNVPPIPAAAGNPSDEFRNVPESGGGTVNGRPATADPDVSTATGYGKLPQELQPATATAAGAVAPPAETGTTPPAATGTPTAAATPTPTATEAPGGPAGPPEANGNGQPNADARGQTGGPAPPNVAAEADPATVPRADAPTPNEPKPTWPTKADPGQGSGQGRQASAQAGDPAAMAARLLVALYPSEPAMRQGAAKGGPGGTPRTLADFEAGEIGAITSLWAAVLLTDVDLATAEAAAIKQAGKVAKRRQPARKTNGALWGCGWNAWMYKHAGPDWDRAKRGFTTSSEGAPMSTGPP